MTEGDVPLWLKNLPMAPEYRPTETEFADPIAFISRIEREAAAFGICKVIPPLPKPSKRFVLSNLNRSLSKSPELGDAAAGTAGPSPESAVFTTRHQELGSRRARPAALPKQVWQSGDVYTLEQFEGKSKAFARSHLGGFKEVTPLLVESLFWKAVMEKPINIEYANDVPGSGFAVPEEPFRYISWRRNRKRGLLKGKANEEKCGFRLTSSSDNGQPKRSWGSCGDKEGWKGTSGWKLSNSRWNLQVIARSPGSLTRFMPDDVPGVTSPMVYIGMLFSWFAWHVEDHELHSMNYLHMGSPKTWYAVPQDHAATLEEIVRCHGYGGSVDRLAAFIMLGEKTTLLSPEVLVASGVPCCRLVQHPGEFVVTFPRAYHVGFSHGFNCGEAANFATPEWLKVAKEAAIRRAAMNHLPMLSHQQLLYILTMSFVSRIPRTLISGVRSSRLKDRKKEEREILVKKAFLTDMMSENYLLCVLLEKKSISPILWEPYMLPASCAVSQCCPSISLKAQTFDNQNGCCIYNQQKEISTHEEISKKVDDFCVKKPFDEAIALNACPDILLTEPYKDQIHLDLPASDVEALEIAEDEDELPVGLSVDSGSLACVACGTLGYPFMAVIQPSVKAAKRIFSITCEEPNEKSDKSWCLISPPCVQNDPCNFTTERCTKVAEQGNLDPSWQLFPKSSETMQHFREHDMPLPMDNGSSLNYFSMDSLQNKGETLDATDSQTKSNRCVFDSSANTFCSSGLHPCGNVKEFEGILGTKNGSGPFFEGDEESHVKGNVGVPKWDVSNVLLRPRVFCLNHAIEVEELLQNKGGGLMRITCHSDYLKFKAYAASIAEEMGTELHLKDVPLENASQEDLNLINISIDEEEHQEDGKDWTSKLGVNLRYSVKLRKHSASPQEQLPSALQRMFSNPSTVSVVSNLKWLCRKSRTPAKPLGINVVKPRISATVERGVQTFKVAGNDNIKAIQVYQSRKKKTNYLPSDDHNHPGKELSSCNQNSKFVRSENVENLFTVPISMIENHEISQNSIEKRNRSPSVADISTTNLSCFHLPAKPSTESHGVNDRCFSGLNGLNNTTFVSVPVNYQSNQVYNNAFTSISSVPYEEKNAGESSANFDGGRHGNLELQDNTVIRESRSSETNVVIALCEGERCGIISTEGEMDKTANRAVRESMLEGELIHICSKTPLLMHECAVDNCKPQHEPCTTKAADFFPFALNIKSYVRRKNKRKWEVEQRVSEEHIEPENTATVQNKLKIYNKTEGQQTSNGFARSPCEGLRPRKGKLESFVAEPKISDTRKQSEVKDAFECNIEGCHMVFRTRSKLRLHKQNRCTYDECRKRFSHHKYAMRHQRVHKDERPFRCSWRGCKMSFKWEWARTEHLRLHTGERPYKCFVAGCGLSFRFVSDFSRHRRKSGHFVSTNGS
ncbi:probable lysine-specific demethylase ELF6 isoform X2 [Phalaenopsis equestris]|uniref:probable lysine-specific demethylase ELF6 isoform X2 n=1 Tax=Phalaenopsis equestris TaxID=78828 RepID=UPI0009E33D84|nr:probable lysine-specific demethylase ELF6 isoform X2 [Phalaenopsis equestris]